MDRNDLQDNDQLDIHQNLTEQISRLPLSYSVRSKKEYSILLFQTIYWTWTSLSLLRLYIHRIHHLTGPPYATLQNQSILRNAHPHFGELFMRVVFYAMIPFMSFCLYTVHWTPDHRPHRSNECSASQSTIEMTKKILARYSMWYISFRICITLHH